MKKILAIALTLIMSVGAMTGCGKKSPEKLEEEAAQAQAQAQLDRKTMELRQNDYRGGITRMQAVQENILEVMENMKSNNIILREDSPNSFWSAEGYQDFVATFLDIPIVADTCWFNEEEGDWETTLSMMATVKNSFTVSDDNGGYKLAATVVRNEKDDYSVSGVSGTFCIDPDMKKKYDGQRMYRILYDCDKDWCKAYCTQTLDSKLPDVTVQMLEYMRIDDNTFVVQTSRERLLVILKPVEGDTDLREREVKEFYYSKLVQEGMRTTFDPYEPLPEFDAAADKELPDNKRANEFMANFLGINEKGNVSVLYGQGDSAFFRSPNDITPSNFVFEDKSLQQAICYKDGVLVVTTYNKLSKNYERFTYKLKDADKNIAGELEKLVEINNLVGIQELPDLESNEIANIAEESSKAEAEKEKEENTKVEEKIEEETATAPENVEDAESTDTDTDTVKTEEASEAPATSAADSTEPTTER